MYLPTKLYNVYGNNRVTKKLSQIPSFRVYHFGRKYLTTSNNNKAEFSITSHNNNEPFYLLITDESINWNKKLENMIHCLKISSDQAEYEFYKLTPKELITDNSYHLNWEINKSSLEDGKIPDNCIIIILPASWVDFVNGGDSIHLPTITLKSDLPNISNCEKSLHTAAELLLLQSLDIDTLHSKNVSPLVRYTALTTSTILPTTA